MEGTPLSQAFLVLFVGMITVIIILLLVVLSGKMLISVINRYFPLPPEKVTKERARTKRVPDKNVAPKKLAAIVAAVEAVTGAKGVVTKIERI